MATNVVMVKRLSPAAQRRRALLERAVELLDISLRDLADLLGVNASTVSRWQHGGREIPADVLPKVTALIRKQRQKLEQLERDLANP